eukprot:scaffold41421_cov36-Tisochrysis_lutea.AAC.2
MPPFGAFAPSLDASAQVPKRCGQSRPARPTDLDVPPAPPGTDPQLRRALAARRAANVAQTGGVAQHLPLVAGPGIQEAG